METLDIIKILCEKEGIKIASLEKEMGYGNGSLSKAKKIPAERVYELSKRFKVSMEYLTKGDEEHHHVNNSQTLAAHFDGDEYTEEELEEIRQFAEFVKNKRK